MNTKDIGTIDFLLHGVRLRLESRHPGFLQAAAQTLAELRTGDTAKRIVRPGRIQIEARLNWEAAPPQTWQQAGSRKWGRRLFQRDQRVLQSEILSMPGLQIETAWEDQHLCVEAFFRRPTAWRGLPQRLFGEARLYAALSYYLVYFPLLHYLEQTRNLHLLHAAGLVHPEGGVLLAGLPGSGKSTFSVSFLEDARVRLLSDNLVIYDKEQVYSCPETIHLSGDSLRRLSTSALRRLEGVGYQRSHGRDVYRLDKNWRAHTIRPKALFFLGLAEQTVLRPVPTALAVDRLVGMDGMAKEINAYYQFAAAAELGAPSGSQSSRRYAALLSVLQKTACFELWLGTGEDLRQGRRLVNDVLAAQVGDG